MSRLAFGIYQQTSHTGNRRIPLFHLKIKRLDGIVQQQRVRVQQEQILPLCILITKIIRLTEAQVPATLNETNPVILLKQLYTAVCRGIIYQNHLEQHPRGLCKDRIDAVLSKFFGIIIDDNDRYVHSTEKKY